MISEVTMLSLSLILLNNNLLPLYKHQIFFHKKNYQLFIITIVSNFYFRKFIKIENINVF